MSLNNIFLNETKIKNIIQSEVFKYLYIKAINSKIYNYPIPNKLCYYLKESDINYAKYILEKYNIDLMIVKKKYIPDICILFYKNNKRSFVINMNMSTNKITGIYEYTDYY